jgi:hypothetical protein
VSGPIKLHFLTRQQAADDLTSMGKRTTSQGLADMAHNGEGPHYSIVRGRALYRREDVEAWLKAEFECGARKTVRARTVSSAS